jgi:2-polyprenyl-6-methoxyphenol hydroxylase-like FAD-dependent oxidoreductase
MASKLLAGQAVVLGAGMAGLAAARVLADCFERVTVLERDTLPTDTSHRSGTPQSRHVHALLGGGQRALSDLFPGVEHDLARAGAVPFRVGLDVRFETPRHDPFPRRDLGWIAYSMSRPLIELIVRRRVEQQANVRLCPCCRAQTLEATPDGSAVTAVGFVNSDGRSERLAADLVVDASGRGNLTRGLLEAVGQPPPQETVIGVDIGYSSAIFAIPDDFSDDWKAVRTLAQVPQHSRGGLMVTLEGNRWILTLGGRHADKPPGDPDGFLAYAQQLRTPTIYNAIRRAERLGDIARFGFPASVWRHFERIETFPRGLLPIGDAICRFNPVYGQGMSVAAQEAVLLRRLLLNLEEKADPLAQLAPAFFAEARALIETPWALAAIPDFVFPRTEGERPPDFERTREFGAALTLLAARDANVHKLMVEVEHLLKPRSVLRKPDLLERVRAVMAEA